ncbi:hypothetical protein E4634_07805 [Mangrovimicrobium sediminis]|uniref:Thiamin/hydroxymethyl pyrimidine-binding YkoF putative domain-containing protein n=1 Tax=Mangrovimicrobium sediminis TaxID=2562682 RepID=A0A4Z0M3J8_9GAMM|nr:YkoF family thiamine/hydroxymethylpyrimidine-binding protein [Haliea sp. SAOS-164]TGD74034.1 hypothetical protein E4634_07805 [Haliea sp. SAOS-164]
MKLTAELSLYPLNEAYIEVIKAFIADLAGREGLLVRTNAMSTQLCGDWDAVTGAVSAALRESHERFGKQVLVCKFIPGELDIAQ